MGVPVVDLVVIPIEVEVGVLLRDLYRAQASLVD